MKNNIYIHYKNGKAYKVIEDENLYIQENGKWKNAVMYELYASNSNQRFIRTIEEFKQKFKIIKGM